MFLRRIARFLNLSRTRTRSKETGVETSRRHPGRGAEGGRA